MEFVWHPRLQTKFLRFLVITKTKREGEWSLFGIQDFKQSPRDPYEGGVKGHFIATVRCYEVLRHFAMRP
jgi:hypothetical protein